MDTCKRMWSKEELTAAGSKMYNHLLVVKFTTENKTRSVSIMTSSSAKYTLDTLKEYLAVMRHRRKYSLCGLISFVKEDLFQKVIMACRMNF